MGCAPSKRIEAAVDVYRPAPTSLSVFDINAIEEPWLKLDGKPQLHQEKPTYIPPPIMEKLNSIEEAPRTWDEVSKVLEDLKPTLNNPTPPTPNPVIPVTVAEPVHTLAQDSIGTPPKKETPPPRKSFSFHTLEELDAKLSSKPTDLTRTESMPTESNKVASIKPDVKKFDKNESQTGFVPATDSGGYKPVRENIFIVRDRLERQKEGKAVSFVKREPLSDYTERCPPGGANSVVIYTTSLGGVRRTYEDCNRVRSILEFHRVVFDERDVSLHGEFLNELKELVGEGMGVPRMFVKGRFIGGVEEVVSLNETGGLGRIMSWAGVDRGVGRQACEVCGGARFVPCLDCGGSCKVLIGYKKERCSECNENGLMLCPACV